MKEITINGAKYLVSFVDTKDTIRNMIAEYEEIPPKFIKFINFNLLDSDITIDILKNRVKGIPIYELSQLIDTLTDWKLEKSEIALEWLRINRSGKVDSSDFDLVNIFKEIDPINFWSENSIETAYKNYERNIKDELDKLIKTNNEEKKFRIEYNNYTPVETSNFLQDSIIIEYKITINLDPLDAFNNLKLNKIIPFCRLQNVDQVYYKILKDFTFPKQWLTGESTITFKLESTKQKDDWGTATINYLNMEESGSPYTAIMTIESTLGTSKELQEEEIRKNILNLFTDTVINIVERTEKGIKGIFAVPDVKLSRDVFLDLITNEKLVSHYLYVDETRDLSSEKGVLYLYFAVGDNTEDVLTVFLSDRIVSRNDPYYLNKEMLLFTPYLNVRVSRALNLNQINNFKEAFAIILDVYRKKFDSISDLYNKFIPGFKSANFINKKKIADVKNIKELQLLDSELFVHGYPTKCEKKKQPIPIKKEDIPKMGKKQVLNYPKGSDNYFVCGDKEYKYPGLIKNKLDNNDKFDYLPCCYKVNQTIGNKNLNIYLKNLTVEKTKTSNIVTRMAVEDGKLGYLPKNIHYILQNNLKKDEEFLRYGVPIGNNSFIHVVLLALDPNYEKTFNKKDYVQDFRNNLAGENMSTVIQQLYDVNSVDFVKDLMDNNVIFDSKLYIGLLENYFNCNIIVFIKSEEEPNGTFEIPRYTQGYLYNKLTSEKPTVLVYKHFGSRSDNLQTEHCELIIKRYKKTIMWHFNDNNLIRKIYSYFLRSYQLYQIGLNRYTPISNIDQDFPEIKSQIVDRYGKCRGFIFPQNIYLNTSPIIPSYNIPIDSHENVEQNRASQQDVLQFINKHKLQIIAQDVLDNKVIGFTINIKDIPYAYIPCQPSTILSEYPQRKHLGFSTPTSDDILEYSVLNRKIADFLMQLLLYSFSIWYNNEIKKENYKKQFDGYEKESLAIKQNKIKVLIMSMVEIFLSTKITVIPKHDYLVKNLPRRLTINNSFFVNDKLVADSIETKNRLGFYLRFMIDKNRLLVLEYYKQLFLNNYYTFTADFKSSKDELVFIGDLSISNWLASQDFGINNETYSVPNMSLKEPFFFTHWALNNNFPILIQNVKNGDFKRALAVAANYINNGINIGYDAKPIKSIPFASYFFQDRLLMRDGDENSPVKLWRFSNNNYAAMLF